MPRAELLLSSSVVSLTCTFSNTIQHNAGIISFSSNRLVNELQIAILKDIFNLSSPTGGGAYA